MKIWVLAGAITAATAPFAAAAESTVECQLDTERRAIVQRIEAPTAPAAPTTTARPTVAPREVAPATSEQPIRQAANDRRRSGKRIPDAELIGPRGAL